MSKTSNLKTAMTCQVCGRKHQANTGTIAHHGYTVDHGFFNGTCRGAKSLPFEASRDLLGIMLITLRTMEHDKEQKIEALKVATSVTRGALHCPRSEIRYVSGRAIYPRITLTETDCPYEQMYAGESSFADVRAAEVSRKQRAMEMLRKHIAEQQARYNGWKVTHTFTGGVWVAL